MGDFNDNNKNNKNNKNKNEFKNQTTNLNNNQGLGDYKINSMFDSAVNFRDQQARQIDQYGQNKLTNKNNSLDFNNNRENKHMNNNFKNKNENLKFENKTNEENTNGYMNYGLNNNFKNKNNKNNNNMK